MNNAEYWEKRQLKRYTSGEKKLIEHYKKLEKVMEQSRKDIEAVINKFYIEYASENEISYAEAQRTLNKREIGELKDFMDRVNEHMGEYDQELNNMSIKARITRYEALLKQIDAVLQRTYTEYEQTSLKELTSIYEDTYYRACFDIDQYNGFHKDFAQLDHKGIMEIINYPFDGRSFSDRIWKQKDFLLDKLTQSFTQMLVQGTHPKTLSKEFAKQFKSREYDAYRLLHTEYSYLAENASQKAYEEDEVPAYKYLATLDSRTCGVCGKLDGKIVKMGDGKFGVNMPPLHPLCRCTTVPYYEELDEIVTRIARNKDGENIEVPYDMSYEEWKEKYAFPLYSESELGTFKKRLMADDNVNKHYYAVLKDKFSHGTYDAKRVFNKYVSNDSIIDHNYEGTAIYEGGKIKMHYGADLSNSRGAGATWFHEHGHLIDEKAGNVSNNNQFYDLLQLEYLDILDRFDYDINTIEKQLYSMRNHSAVSDMINGLSDDKIKGVATHPVRFNGESYWSKKSVLQESFAHMFECQFDKIRYNEMKNYFPKSLEFFESLLKGM